MAELTEFEKTVVASWSQGKKLLYTAEEAGEILNCHPDIVRKLEKQRKINKFRNPLFNKKSYYPLTEIVAVVFDNLYGERERE